MEVAITQQDNLDQKEIDLLYEIKQFGPHEPVALQITIWWLLTLHNNWRARNESRQLKWGGGGGGGIQLEKDLISGKERIVWLQERSRKTNNGEKEIGEKEHTSQQYGAQVTSDDDQNHHLPLMLHFIFKWITRKRWFTRLGT